MRKYINENRLFLVTLLTVFLFFSYFLIFNHQIFIFEGDILTENVRMLLQGWDRVHAGTLPFWNWANFLGANYFTSGLFYVLGSPFSWILMLLPIREWIIPGMLIMNILKTMMGAFFTYEWLKKALNHKTGAFVGSMILPFCGFVLTNYNNDVMAAAIFFLPLCLWCVERFLQDNRCWGVSFTIALIGITNFYFLYLFLPFICFYALMRFVALEEFEWKRCLARGSKFVGLCLLGVGMCAFILIPCFFMLINNPRSSEMPELLSTISRYDLYRFLTGFINPINDWRTNNNYYISTSLYGGIGHSGGMAMYSFMIFIFLFPLLFTLKNTREKWSLAALYGTYGVFVLFKVFYVLFNQNLETRWMIVIVFLNVFLCAFVVSKKDEIKPWAIILSALGNLLFIAAALLISRHYALYFDSWGWLMIRRNAVLSALLIVGYFILFFFIKKKSAFQFGLALLLVFEVAYSYGNIFYNDGWSLDPMTQEELDGYGLFDTEVTDWIKEYDDGFYRIDFSSVAELHDNDAYQKDFHSFYGYLSTYNYNQEEFVNQRYKYPNKWIFIQQKGKWMNKNQLSCKYFVRYKKDTMAIPYGFELIHTINGTEIYENQYFIPVAYAAKSVLDEESWNSYSVLMQDRLLLDHVVMDTEVQSIYSDKIDNLVLLDEKEAGNLVIDIQNYDSGVIVLEFDEFTTVGYELRDENWDILDYDFITTDIRYTTLPVTREAKTITCTVNVPVKIYYDDLSWYKDWVNEVTENAITDVIWDDNSISGTFDLTSDEMIVTSVPYDAGWQLFVDGERKETRKVNQGFIGFELEAGKHFVELSFVPYGLKAGAMVSLGSLLVILVSTFYSKRKMPNKV